MSPLPGSPSEPTWTEMLLSRAFLYISSRVPSKELPLQVSLTELPQRERERERERERDATLLEPSFIHLSKSPVNGLPSSFPKWGPHGERCPSPEPSSTYPIRGALLQVPLTELCRERERCSISGALLP